MGDMKPAITLDGKQSDTVSHITYGVAAGWRQVFLRNGDMERMTVAELQARYRIEPFQNVNDLEA